MSDPSEAGATPRARPCPDAQMVVSLAIVAALALLGGALVLAAYSLHDWNIAAAGGVGTIIGALATALNAPSGVSNALKAAKGDAP